MSASGAQTSVICKKEPIKRLEICLRNFTEVSFPTHLRILQKHKANIAEFTKRGEMGAIHREQLNASRIVMQLKSDLMDLDELRERVRKEDLEAFDTRVAPIKEEVMSAVGEFISLRKRAGSRSSETDHDLELLGNDPSPSTVNSEKIQRLELANIELEELKQALESWESLARDLEDLRSIMLDLATSVHVQRQAVDGIEENVCRAQENVAEGRAYLNNAAKLKAVILPFTCCLVGGAVAGPIGLLSGFKLGGVAAAVGGGIAGYTGGKFIRKRTEEKDMELHSMGESRDLTSLSTANQQDASKPEHV